MPSFLRWPVLPDAAPLDLSYPCPRRPWGPAASAISGHTASLARVGRFQDAALRIAVAVFPAAAAAEGAVRREGAGGSRRGQALPAGCHQLLLASGGPGWWEEGAAVRVILGSRLGVPSPSPRVGGKQRQGRWRGPLATQRGSRARFESAAYGLVQNDLLCGGCAPGTHAEPN